MEFDKVTAQHIKQGIKDYEEKGYPDGFGPSSTYDIRFEGKLYPPKAIMAYANYHAAGRTIERYFKGGKDTDCFKAIERNGFEIVEKQKRDLFNWTKTHLELVNYLRDKKNRSKELLQVLERAGVVIGTDQKTKGTTSDIEEIDPFTFFCYIYKYGPTKRLKILQTVAKELKLSIPEGERGIPSSNAQKVWMFPYAYERVGDEFEILWKLFDAAVNNSISNELFQRALNIRNVGKTKITEVLFYVRPFDYFPINGPSKPYLMEELGIEYNFETFEEYQEINRSIKSKSDTSFPELSYKSWHYTHDKNSKTVEEQLAIDEITFTQVLERFTQVQINNFFDFLDETRTNFNIPLDDQRFSYNIRKGERRMALLIGQRTAVSLDSRNNRGVYEAITKKAFEKVSYTYDGDDGVVMVRSDDFKTIEDHQSDIFEQMQLEIDSTIKSGFRQNINRAFEKAVFDKEYRSQFFDINFTVKEPVTNYQNSTMPLNQILYGPPGTGKTYKLQADYFDRFTISKESLTRDQFLKNLVINLTWWQIISLTLYDIGSSELDKIYNHELVEAKSETVNSSSIKQTIRRDLYVHTIEESKLVQTSRRYSPLVFDKDSDGRWKVIIEELEISFPDYEKIINNLNSYKKSDENIKNYEFVTFHQSFTYEDFVEGIKPVLDEEETDLRYEITSGVFKRLSNLARNNPSQPYAIFIDEINRGNVASIFGELITLIEKDKRAGADNELSVILPYSKQKFSVPSNLHIIGTMNTADRSIEALDSALRRRFEFIEMLPNYQVIDEVLNYQEFEGHKLSDILRTINERITVLIDRDHQIGHSYFLKLKGSTDLKADLKAVFQNKIIPLLQEYFFNDYVKIAMVIGEGFMDKDRYSKVTFAQNDGDYESDYSDIVKYEIKKDVDLKDAIVKLMGTNNE